MKIAVALVHLLVAAEAGAGRSQGEIDFERGRMLDTTTRQAIRQETYLKSLEVLEKAYASNKNVNFKMMRKKLAAGEIRDGGMAGLCYDSYAWVPEGNRSILYLCDAFFGAKSDFRLSVMLHESWHMAGNPGPGDVECDADAAAQNVRTDAGMSKGPAAYGKRC